MDLISKNENVDNGGEVILSSDRMIHASKHQFYSSEEVNIEVEFAGNYIPFGSGSGFNLIEVVGITAIKVIGTVDSTTLALVSVNND